MRKSLAVLCFVMLGLLLVSVTMMSQPPSERFDATRWTPEQLAAWQAKAETYYEADVDENFLLGKDRNAIEDIKPGMYAPEFTLLDYDGNPHSLSDYVGKAFIVFATGSWY